MKNIIHLGLLLSLLFFSGCDEMLKEYNQSQKANPNSPRTATNPNGNPNSNPNNRTEVGGQNRTEVGGQNRTEVGERSRTEPDPSQNLRPGRAATLQFKGKPVLLTQHAKCRMGCRYIEEAEIGEVIAQNNINLRKSTPEPTDGKCPTFAYEGKTKDNQQVRVIVADCDREAKIVTVIDLKNDFSCACD